jgi:hypothetical protein
MTADTQTNLIWACALVVFCVCAAIFSKSCMQIERDYMIKCIEAGNKPGECQQARPR